MAANEQELCGGQLRTRDIWALGVGIVVCGQYFGWNLGLKDNGPVAMLLASLVVCLLFLAWVLALSELAVAMPRAGGPLDYGLRAGGRWLGFVMGWSLFLACLFGGVATALAGGKYVAFLFAPAAPDPHLAVAAGLGIVAGFFALQFRGVKEQARALVLMTYAAVLGLVVFWPAAASNFSWARVWATPAIPAEKGWKAVLDAVPFALWWLIIIEAAALAAEEAHAPRRTVPRGLTWAVVTVIGMIVLTTVTACGALPFQQIAAKDGKDIDYPLAEVVRNIPAGRSGVLLYGFGVIALFGLVASYHGLLYGGSRQLYALGRAGFLPRALGRTHAERRTPVPALAACSLLTAGFVVANLWFEDAVKVAVLVAGFAALVLYLLSMVSLFALRRREPSLLAGYRAPLGRWLPAAVVVLAALALAAYPRLDAKVVPLAAAVYAVGLVTFALRRRRWDAPPPVPERSEASPDTASGWGRRVAVGVLLVAVVGVVAVASAGFGGPDAVGPATNAAALTLLTVVVAALVAVGAAALRQARTEDDAR